MFKDINLSLIIYQGIDWLTESIIAELDSPFVLFFLVEMKENFSIIRIVQRYLLIEKR